MKSFKNILILASLFLQASLCYSQSKTTLNIGDSAPELKYSKWIKGTPVTEYKSDHLYAFEFWATWCGPCKAAMPHLSDLAKKYKDKVTFTGVNIWEKTGDKPYESSLPAVTKFVNSIGDKMAYNVVADNNAQDMANKWMIAAGLNGIPATFLLKNSKIIWIGHPMALDSIIESVIANKYDMNAFKEKHDGSKAKNAEIMEKYKTMEPMFAALKAKQYDKVLTIADTLNILDPTIAMQVNAAKVTALFGQKNEIKALEFSKQWLKEDKGFGGTIAGIIIGTEGLSNESYLFAAALGKDVLDQPGVVKPLVYHFMATAYAKANDLKSAIQAEQLAIEGAKDALKKGEFLGSVLDSTVTEFEESLAKYKKK